MEQFKVEMQLTIAERRDLKWNKRRNQQLVWKDTNLSATATPAENTQRF